MVHAGHYQFTIFQVHSSHQDVYIATGQNIIDIGLHSHELRPSTCRHRIWWVLMIGIGSNSRAVIVTLRVVTRDCVSQSH